MLSRWPNAAFNDMTLETTINEVVFLVYRFIVFSFFSYYSISFATLMYNMFLPTISAQSRSSSDGLFKQGGIAIDLGRQAHIDVTVTNDHDQTTDDAGVNLCGQMKALAFLQEASQG